MLKTPAEYERDISLAKFTDINAKFLLLHYEVSVGYCHRTLVDGSGMIRTQIGKHSRSVMVAVYDTPRAIPPRNNNQ
jgi:hypothetical protein